MRRAAAGFFSFTEITDHREHRSYNEWHQLDHLPEQYVLPGIVHGQRWVATPACRRSWTVAAPPFDAAHYLTLYLLAEPVDETLDDFAALARRLRAEGRFHEHRRAVLSGPFDLVDVHAARRVMVSDEAVLYRPNRGVHVFVESPGDALDPTTVASRHDRLLALDGVAGVASFTARAATGETRWRPGDHHVTVCYLDTAPLTVAPSIDDVLRAGSSAGAPATMVRLAGSFETITPWQWDWFDENDRD